MTDKEAMAMALDALEYWDVHGRLHQPTEEAITALKARLAQPEQEPVAWFSPSGNLYKTRFHATANGEQVVTPLYTIPPQRTEQEPEVDLRTRWPMNGWKENKSTPPQRTEPLIGCVNHDCAKCKEKNT
jgi:hypothetical protein